MGMRQGLDDVTRVSDIVSFWAAEQATLPALCDPQGQLSYGELWSAIEKAKALLQKEGVQAGDRVMLVAENCNQQVALLLACMALNVWPANVNARMSEREIDTIAEHCQPRLILFSESVSREAAAHGQRLSARPWLAKGYFGGWLILSCSPSVPPESKVLACDVAALVYTSGTTGAPKGVMVSHAGLLHFARISCKSRGLKSSDHVYGALPLAHIFGFATILLSTLCAGACLTLERRFDPKHFLDAVANQRITTFQGVPTLYIRILEHLQQYPCVLQAPALRYLYSGGASLDIALKRQVEHVFGLPLHQGYGMTEYAGSMFITRTDQPRNDNSSGHINDGVELRLLNELGEPVAEGQVGEIRVRGPGVMRGYYRNQQATDEVLCNQGWFNTGDLGRLDRTGALFIVGRSKDLIIRSGFNVYPVEVEAVLNSWPEILLSAVVGISDQSGNESVVAFVELEPGQQLARSALKSYLKQQLAPYKRPETVWVLKKIPTTMNGKLQKLHLRQWLNDGGVGLDIEVVDEDFAEIT